jgi:formylglycine-generating enzyme required for sulfatase activity
MQEMNHALVLLTLAVTLVLLPACRSQSSSGGDDIDAGPDTDSDTDADTDTETDTESETDTWPVFPSDCYTETINGLELRWCRVPEGTYRMGCDFDAPHGLSCGWGSTPQHDVLISEFEMLDREVTVEMYRACVEAGPCDDPEHYGVYDSGEWNDSHRACRMDRPETYEYQLGYDDHPMNCVDWHGLSTFCEWIGGRLPTEAEWERAARGEHDGLNGEYWEGINTSDVLSYEICSHVNNCLYDGPPCELLDTAPAGSLAHTSFGFHDMVGNVAEWCSDWYLEEYYESSPATDPEGPDAGTYRVMRGHAWADWYGTSSDVRMMVVGRRGWLPPLLVDLDDPPLEIEAHYGYLIKYFVGGRCVRSVEAE